jgi:NAD(P)H-binding
MAIKVGIAGLDGRLASRVALCLLSSPDVTISGYSCTPSKVLSAISSHPGVTIRDGSAFDLENMRSLVRGCDVVVCGYQGPDDIMLHGQKTLIDACEEESVDRYVASDWTLDYTKLEYGQLWTKEPMKDVMAYIKSKTHVKGVHILNGIFMETFFSPFFNLYDPATRTFSAWGEGFEVWEGTSYESAAKWTAEVVLNKSTMGIIRCK